MADWIAEILIGDDVVWSSTTTVPQRGLLLDVAAYTGVKNLEFRIRRTDDPTPLDLEAQWWDFYTRAAPNDGISSQGDYSPDLDPAGDFTIVTLVEELDSVYRNQSDHGLVGKLLTGIGKTGGYEVAYNGSSHGSPGQIRFTLGNYRDLWLAVNVMALGRKVLIACMFQQIGDWTSIARIVTYDAVNGKQFAQRNDMPWTGTNDYNLDMGWSARLTRGGDVRMYWAGIYDGVFFSDQDVEDIWTKVKHPIDDFTPVVFNYFSQDVAATYNGDVCNGANAPYIFDVVGTPTKGP